MVRKGGASRSRMVKKHAKKAERATSRSQGAMGRWRASGGGMNKWQELYDLIQRSNVIVEIVDARNVDGTRVLTAERWADAKSLMLVANKADLLSKDAPSPRGILVVSARSQDPEERKKLLHAIMAKTMIRPIKALFIGYPNIGKSSLINMLAKRRAAKVSPIAGTTKSEQWVSINEELMVTDYRGVYPETELKVDLVRKGALNVQADAEAYAFGICERILRSRTMREWCEKKYDISLEGAKSSEEVLASIAKRRGWFIKGGELNIAEAARSLVRAMREAPEI
jgi:ribosome biogenesis GTPase A